MSLADLAVVYLIVGACCGVAVYRVAPGPGPRAIASAALAVPLWPLWAPIALTAGRVADRARSPLPGGEAARVEAALGECVEACAHGPLAALLPRDAAASIAQGIRRAATRQADLDEVLARADFDRAAADRRVAELERAAASPRAIATARLHQGNVRRLHELRARDARALAELADLVGALRTQLTLARFGALGVDLDAGGRAQPGATPGAEGIGGIVAEMWARVEGLDAAMETDPGAPGAEASDA